MIGKRDNLFSIFIEIYMKLVKENYLPIITKKVKSALNVKNDLFEGDNAENFALQVRSDLFPPLVCTLLPQQVEEVHAEIVKIIWDAKNSDFSDQQEEIAPIKDLVIKFYKDNISTIHAGETVMHDPAPYLTAALKLLQNEGFMQGLSDEQLGGLLGGLNEEVSVINEKKLSEITKRVAQKAGIDPKNANAFKTTGGDIVPISGHINVSDDELDNIKAILSSVFPNYTCIRKSNDSDRGLIIQEINEEK